MSENREHANVILIYIYIYIYAFSRRFYPKRLTLHSNYSFFTFDQLLFIKISGVLKGDLTHTVSPNLMLILSTYRVVLHPSYLQKVFRFIIFIKERYRFTILSEKSRAPGGVSWAELKSEEHLRRSPTKQRHLMSFHLPSAVLNHDQDLL